MHPDLGDTQVSDKLELEGARVAVGDFVYYGDSELGSVVACALDGNQLFVIVDTWRKTRVVSPHSAQWEGQGRRAVWMASGISECVAWREMADGGMLVIRQ